MYCFPLYITGENMAVYRAGCGGFGSMNVARCDGVALPTLRSHIQPTDLEVVRPL